ncbi:3-methylcrotonyl-CoA carboxylase beta subunit OS=Bosea thiooxidans OX=53254 GN=SAMN05660750_01855 PE=4 SV=1 [Bosea thiooxidans]|uniref:3-methylcrotonyl-CoA carboxylase beta subunit n=1 Tax=Bosea thiooxidans TaxID=53254 RepID=A0A1T5D9N3_9HYPH|nr:carboxyl transferase domain-containing protein [Bosea thiooxidans]SKB68385.1 3-methylcrotonyl-CoA carboxylase beta subunit [Bosea thiooxidans]
MAQTDPGISPPPPLSAMLETLRERHGLVALGGGEKLRARHESRGKIMVRERVDLLLDPQTPFLELSPLAAWGLYGNEVPGAGIVTGIGIVQGRACMLIANDATVKGGSFFAETVRKHLRAQEIAEEHRLPCLYLVDCGGAFLPEQDRVFPDRDHFGGSFYNQCRMSAAGIPQISIVFGGATAGGAYIPALSDQVIMVKGTGRIHLGGPPIVKAAVHEIVDGETLGGAEMHTLVSGVSDHLVETEMEGLAKLREIVGALGEIGKITPPPQPPAAPKLDPAELVDIVPTDLRRPYDVREVIARMVDDSAFSAFKPDYGATLVTGFAHIHGYPVGILANNGVLFSESAVKGAHFIELCDQRQIPLIFLQNITGFMVGTEAERGGIAKHSAKLVYTVSNARVPKYTVLIGGSYGAGNYGMCGRGFRPRLLFSWPNARIATMSPEVAATVVTELRRQSLKGAADEAAIAELDRRTRAQFEEQSDPYYATARLWDDGIIEPAQTRDVLGLCLALSAGETRDTGPRPVYRM